MKKPVKITLWSIVIILVVAAILVFLVLPNYFAATEAEIKELEQTNVDSLMNLDVPEAPEAPVVVDVPSETES